MRDSIHQRYADWQLDELLGKYSDLRVEPTWSSDLVISGTIAFRVAGPNGNLVEDSYAIGIRVDSRFPSVTPVAYEIGSRISTSYHKLEGNYFCLGAPTALRMRLSLSPTLLTFVDEFVIPYLAGYTHFTIYGTTLYGELAHGSAGIREFLRELFHSTSAEKPEEFLRLASLKKTNANKCICPCRSGRRLGKCHNRYVNPLRHRMGRRWFQEEYARLIKLFPCSAESTTKELVT